MCVRRFSHRGSFVAMAGDPGPDVRMRRQWADWAAHGYRKLYQPRSVLWFGGIFVTLFGAGLLVVFWLAAHGRWQ